MNKDFERKILNIFLLIHFNICLGAQKSHLNEPSYRDGSFEYPQHVLVEKSENLFFGTH